MNVQDPVPLQRSGGPLGDLPLRTLSSIVLLALALGAAYAGGLVAALVVAFFSVLVLFEWVRLTSGRTGRSIVFAAAVAGAIVAAGLDMLPPALLTAALAAIAAGAISRDAWLPAGVVYASALGIGIMAIREAPDHGLAALVFVLAIVWSTDSGAFFIGRRLGGPKLVPLISPKKTWSGAIGGLFAAMIAGLLAAWLMDVPLTVPLAIVALFLSIVCQAGDLFESWVKRRFGAKDSGSLIPGHGGIMDRVDGLIFAAAAGAGLGFLHGGPGGIGRGLLLW